MFSKILIASDLSEASDEMIRCVQGLRLLGSREAVLFHALRIRHLDDLKYELARYAEPQLQKQKDALEALGFTTKIEIAPSETAYELERAARKENISLVVIATHGKSLLKHAFMGGEATKILQHHTKPVLVVRIAITEREGETKCEASCLDPSRKILYATDFSDTAQRAFTYVEMMVESGWKRITVLHVQDSTRIDKHLKERLDEFNSIDTERLEMLKDALVKKGASEVDIALSYGLPFQEITKMAKSNLYSIIVMGSQGRGFAEEIFLGSVSHNLVRHARIPVLLVPALR
jgi:nucleotide-binding universal stress UspA family protein